MSQKADKDTELAKIKSAVIFIVALVIGLPTAANFLDNYLKGTKEKQEKNHRLADFKEQYKDLYVKADGALKTFEDNKRVYEYIPEAAADSLEHVQDNFDDIKYNRRAVVNQKTDNIVGYAY